MRRYKLYLDGIGYIDSDGNRRYYKIITHRNSKRAASDYGKNATITDMHDNVVSAAKIATDGRVYNVCI